MGTTAFESAGSVPTWVAVWIWQSSSNVAGNGLKLIAALMTSASLLPLGPDSPTPVAAAVATDDGMFPPWAAAGMPRSDGPDGTKCCRNWLWDTGSSTMTRCWEAARMEVLIDWNLGGEKIYDFRRSGSWPFSQW